MKRIAFIILSIIISKVMINAQNNYESDIIKTSAGEIKMTFIGHASLVFEFNGKVIHIDPVGRYGDYSTLPKADLILITHEHGDHLDPDEIGKTEKGNTRIICNEVSSEQLGRGEVMKNGDKKNFDEIIIEAVPAYNLVNKRKDGNPYHPKGNGNGYVLTFGDKRIYIAGDTENIPEMKNLKDIDIAFLPMNLPYTMSPEMVADAVKMFNPSILYPYHYGTTDPDEIVQLLKDKKDCEVRIRKLR